MTTRTTHDAPTARKATWSSRIEVTSLTGGDLEERARATRDSDEQRPRTSRIEREIISAVVVLYAAIIACFAGLHIFGVVAFG